MNRKIRLKLRTKLILSYTVLSLLLIIALLVVANILLNRQFNSYVLDKNESRNLEFVQAVLSEVQLQNRHSGTGLYQLGENALNDGVILIVHDTSGREIFNMNRVDDRRCRNMLNSRQQSMRDSMPRFEGEYMEVTYPLSGEGGEFGTVTLGYIGPYYYNESEAKFISMLNNLFIRAAAVFLVVAVILGIIMADRIAAPIWAVIFKAMKIGSGDYGGRINLSSTTKEIQALIESVNSLAVTLETHQKLQKRMAMDYAHEFRTPLTAMRSNVEGIIDGVFQPTTQRLECIREEIIRLSNMVSDIDKITEMQIQKPILHRETFNLSDLIKQTATAFERGIKDKGITLTINADPCPINADKDKISSLLINLISNAVKYTGENGKIDIILDTSPSQVSLKITDDGIGISKDDLPYIFEHLYRADTSRARGSGGTGIGLSSALAVCHAHGGNIQVRSEVGKGSIFMVVLPRY